MRDTVPSIEIQTFITNIIPVYHCSVKDFMEHCPVIIPEKTQKIT